MNLQALEAVQKARGMLEFAERTFPVPRDLIGESTLPIFITFNIVLFCFYSQLKLLERMAETSKILLTNPELYA
jgi:hypothetical protein